MTVLRRHAAAGAAAAHGHPPWEAGKWQFRRPTTASSPLSTARSTTGETRATTTSMSACATSSPSPDVVPGVTRCAQRRRHLRRRLLRGPRRSHVADARFLARQHRPPSSSTRELNLGVKTTFSTVAGDYRVETDPAGPLDLLAGARLLDVETTLGFSVNGDSAPAPYRAAAEARRSAIAFRTGLSVSRVVTRSRMTEVVLPFYLDVGTGQTK